LSLIDIDKSIKKYLPKGGDTVKKAMRYSVLSGGKRIRPILVVESAIVCGGKATQAMPAACAVEFIHAYSLIHDDLPAMDNDDYRRGKPACHKVFGEANAILAGDALLTLAFNVIASSVEPKKATRIIKELSLAAGAEGMGLGQALDLESYQFRAPAPELVDLLKTAKLFEAATRIGAIAAGADKRKINALGRFGRYFGLFFQAVDDRIDGERKKGADPKNLIEKAKRELDIFGRRADKLKAIADYAVKRKI
jgi:geranylgeranyl diphosphate synthase type II